MTKGGMETSMNEVCRMVDSAGAFGTYPYFNSFKSGITKSHLSSYLS